ncbi:MAG: hypothetical protein PHH73_00165 [Candidatus Rickettsiella isopodorum]|nr:hypothetical protein [Candidatus Rickettsiella isopodorum]
MADMNKVLLAMAVYQNVKPLSFRSIIDTLRNSRDVGFDLEYDDALISRSRNLLTMRFLESKYKVILFIDDDIFFIPEHIDILSKHCLNGYDIIGGLYPTRSGKTCASRMVKGTRCHTPVKNTQPIEAEYISTGFMAIHRKVFEKLINENKIKLAYGDRERFSDVEPYYPFFEAMWHDGEWLSEDWGFCKIAKDVGFKCWLSPSVFLGHEGRYVYTLRDAFRLPVDNNKVIELYRK